MIDWVDLDEKIRDRVAEFLLTQETFFRIAHVQAYLKKHLDCPDEYMPSDKGVAVMLRRLGCQPLPLRSIRGKKLRLWQLPSRG